MIIDLILDRKYDDEHLCDFYDAKHFYDECMEYSAIFDGIGDDITRAMDFGTEDDVRKALCEYILNHGYNPEICEYINSRNWICED